MKARIKETGEIVDIEDMSIVTYKSSDGTYVKTLIKNFTFLDAEKDYYTKLEHQYAGMAMQGILTNPIGFENIRARGVNIQIETALLAREFAHALVQELKEEEERK